MLSLKVITFISYLFANPKDRACGSEVIVYIDLCIECTKKAMMAALGNS